MLIRDNYWLWYTIWNYHFLLAYFIGEADTGAGSNGPVITEAYSRSGNMLEQHFPYAPTGVWPKGTLRAVLEGPPTDIAPFTTEQYDIIAESLILLSQFNDATVELSEEKRVSGSKVIPLLSMLHHSGWESEEAINGETSCHWWHCSIRH